MHRCRHHNCDLAAIRLDGQVAVVGHHDLDVDAKLPEAVNQTSPSVTEATDLTTRSYSAVANSMRYPMIL